MRQIPTLTAWSMPECAINDYRSINYNGSIYVILLDDKGNWADFQGCGTAISHHRIRGFVFKSFKSKLKWFNPDWWYKMTCWGDYYPNKLFFNTTKEHMPKWSDNVLSMMPVGEERTAYVMDASDRFHKWSNEIANEGAISVEYILNKILKETQRLTNIQFELDLEDVKYGDKWGEAFVPLKYKGNKYLLTWENCD